MIAPGCKQQQCLGQGVHGRVEDLEVGGEVRRGDHVGPAGPSIVIGGRLVAKGEVLVLDGCFRIRVTQLLGDKEAA